MRIWKKLPKATNTWDVNFHRRRTERVVVRSWTLQMKKTSPKHKFEHKKLRWQSSNPPWAMTKDYRPKRITCLQAYSQHSKRSWKSSGFRLNGTRCLKNSSWYWTSQASSCWKTDSEVKKTITKNNKDRAVITEVTVSLVFFFRWLPNGLDLAAVAASWSSCGFSPSQEMAALGFVEDIQTSNTWRCLFVCVGVTTSAASFFA